MGLRSVRDRSRTNWRAVGARSAAGPAIEPRNSEVVLCRADRPAPCPPNHPARSEPSRDRQGAVPYRRARVPLLLSSVLNPPPRRPSRLPSAPRMPRVRAAQAMRHPRARPTTPLPPREGLGEGRKMLGPHSGPAPLTSREGLREGRNTQPAPSPAAAVAGSHPRARRTPPRALPRLRPPAFGPAL